MISDVYIAKEWEHWLYLAITKDLSSPWELLVVQRDKALHCNTSQSSALTSVDMMQCCNTATSPAITTLAENKRTSAIRSMYYIRPTPTAIQDHFPFPSFGYTPLFFFMLSLSFIALAFALAAVQARPLEPIVTTIWGVTDCNANRGPMDPIAPCPPVPTSTVMTIWPTDASATITETLPAVTTSSDEPVVTTIWTSHSCNDDLPPGMPIAPCPPWVESTVITLTPSETTTTSTLR